MLRIYRMREFRIDQPRDQGPALVKFLTELGSSGWLISFEKGLVTSKDHWQGWVDSSVGLSDDYQLRKLKDLAIKQYKLTKGGYAFPIINDVDKWFAYICKHKSKDVIEVHHSYSSEDLEVKYSQATEWLSKEEFKKEQKKIPFLRRCVEVAKSEVLFVHPDGKTYMLRYDLIRKLMYRMFNANEKAFDVFGLQKHAIGVANYFEEKYGTQLIQGRRCQRILGGELETSLTDLFKEVDQSILQFAEWKNVDNDI